MSDVQRPRRGRPSTIDRGAVLTAAITVLRDEGPSALTVRRLAAEVGVSRQVVYTQFGSLGGLIDALYRQGCAELREAAATVDASLTGVDRVVALAVGYRAYALARPELYAVVFERTFREFVPSAESRAVAVDAFQPMVDAVASTGRKPGEARSLALTLWGAIHGLVHLELQGFFAFEPSSSQRIVDVVKGTIDHCSPTPRKRTKEKINMIERVIERWHQYMRGELEDGLDGLLDDDVVFYSPIVYTPQAGKAITKLYLQAAAAALPGEESSTATPDGRDSRFRYTKEVLAGDIAVLEFETTVDGKYVNGVDIIRCNDAGRIVEFRVMIRPLQAVNIVHQQMKAMLETHQELS